MSFRKSPSTKVSGGHLQDRSVQGERRFARRDSPLSRRALFIRELGLREQSTFRPFRRAVSRLLGPVRAAHGYLWLSREAKLERRRNARGLPAQDPGIQRALQEGLQWICLAQDRSVSRDGGVARHYSLLDGWSPSYPETTGYIVPTLLACAQQFSNEALRRRAKRMLDWLESIQFPEGGFPGGVIGAQPAVPVTFNTGQILLGLAAGVEEFGGYREALRRAADWLVDTQDADGCWRDFPTPFAAAGEKTYETHVAWGLLEAARVESEPAYAEAALANVRWALGFQRSNGWIEQCCLTDPSRPLTHTLGYFLRGVLEAYRFSGQDRFLLAARRTGDGLLTALRRDGFLPGRLLSDWRGAVKWACLTGTAQVAHCWLLLYQFTGQTRYLEAAQRANRYLRRTQQTEGREETRGAIAGSFPIQGEYCSYQYPNWACKFYLDALRLEADLASNGLEDRESQLSSLTPASGQLLENLSGTAES